MEDNNKPTSEFENLVKEATGEIPTVKEEKDVQNQASDESKNSDIQIIDEESKVELPQTKNGDEPSNLPKIEATASDSKTIGTIKPDKQKSPIAMLVLFGVLILFIVFMPTAISLFNKYFGTDLNVDSLNNPTSTNVPEQQPNQEKQEIKMYPLKEDTVISIDKIDFGGFKKLNDEDYKISFYIKNNGTVLYKFEKKIYLEFYDDNNTFVGRSYIESVKEVTGGITNNYTIDTNNDINTNATKVEVVQRTEDDYPAINLVNKQLTCTNETTNIVYTFDDSSKLTYIKDMYTYTKDDDTLKYNNDLISYKAKVSRLDIIEGVTAVLTETDSGFITTTAIDYQSADYSKVSSNTNYYIKDTYAKTISFEMNAKGFTCR